VVERSAKVIGRVPSDAIAVYLALKGESWFTQRGATRTLRPGDALICETDEPFARGFPRGLEELVVKVDQEAIEPVKNPTITPGPYTRALARLVARATRTESPVRPDERTVLELVTVLATGPRAAQPAAYRAAARSFIEEHLTDPSLGADRVAAAVGISGRHLSRLFAADETSVPRYILSRRLELAHSMLLGARADTVADVAARCGFVSATYFSHAFRERFGQRAGEILRS